MALSNWGAVRDPELASYISERLARGEALVALHGPPPISPVLIQLGWETEQGIESGLVRALAAAGVPALEVELGDRRARRRAARAGCAAVLPTTHLLQGEAGEPLGPSLEEALATLAPRAAVEVLIPGARLLAQPGVEALSLDRSELQALRAGSRDPAPRLALRALDAGAVCVRIGSPQSLRAGQATCVTSRHDLGDPPPRRA